GAPVPTRPSEQTTSKLPNPSGEPSPASTRHTNSYPGDTLFAPPEASPLPSSPTNVNAKTASLTWSSLRLDQRPASHLAAGKRRVAAIVADADNKRRLVVFALPGPMGSGAATPARSVSVPVEPRVDVTLPT